MKVIDEDIQTALKFTDKHKQGKPEFTVEDNFTKLEVKIHRNTQN
jgi:hypothetical protein